MEEAAKRRIERLKQFQLGVQEPVITGLRPSEEQNDGNLPKEEYVETAESLAQRILQENTFVPTATNYEQMDIKKANWDLKKEYERKSADLEIKKKEKLEELLQIKIDEDIKLDDD
jgi:hypothetical protein